MKAQLFLLIACLSLTAADLGVISPRHGILLNTQTTRTDFHRFEVELKPSGTTNVVTLTLTNNLITVDDMAALPSGRTTMGVKSCFLDGSVSDLAIYAFDLRRAAPPAPSARRATLRAGSEPPKSLINELERRYMEQAMPPPPSPWIQDSTNGLDMATGLPTTEVFIRFTNAATDLIFTNGLRALTGATNRTYGEHLDWIEDRKAKRRNE